MNNELYKILSLQFSRAKLPLTTVCVSVRKGGGIRLEARSFRRNFPSEHKDFSLFLPTLKMNVSAWKWTVWMSISFPIPIKYQFVFIPSFIVSSGTLS